MIANRELGNAIANRLDDTCPISHWNATVAGGYGAADNTEVVIVERAGVHAHANLAGFGCIRLTHINQLETIKSAWGSE
jgi:hypothetical protein